jgi:hypothetical protein
MLSDRPHGELHARGELRDWVRARGYRDHAADFLDLARFSATDAWTSAVPMMIVALGVIGTLHESNHDTLSPRTIRAPSYSGVRTWLRASTRPRRRAGAFFKSGRCVFKSG